MLVKPLAPDCNTGDSEAIQMHQRNAFKTLNSEYGSWDKSSDLYLNFIKTSTKRKRGSALDSFNIPLSIKAILKGEDIMTCQRLLIVVLGMLVMSVGFVSCTEKNVSFLRQ